MKIKVDTSKLLKQVEAFGRVQRRLQSIADKLGAMGEKNDWDDIYDGIAESIKYDISADSDDITQCASVCGAYWSFITDSCKQYDECDAEINKENEQKNNVLQSSDLSQMMLLPNGLKYPEYIGAVKRGKPMTFEEADTGKENPYYFDGNGNVDYPYSINCQRCVPVFLLRLLGYNVSAKPNIKDDDDDGYADGSQEKKNIFGIEYTTKGRRITDNESLLNDNNNSKNTNQMYII